MAGPEPLLHPIPEGMAMLGIGRSMLYELIAAGEIETVKIGRRTLLSRESLVRYVSRRLADQPAGVAGSDGAVATDPTAA